MLLEKRKTIFQFRTRSALRGFSLLELMTVAGIIGIMTSIVLVSFSSGRTDEVLKTSAREVANALREVQNDALSGLRPSGVNSGSTVCWFSIERSGSSSVNLKVYHSNVSDCSSGMGQLSIRTFQLKGGATFSSSMAYGFRLPHGRVVDTAGADIPGGIKTIMISAAGKSIAVCLDPASGAIRETSVGGSCS